MEILLTTVGSAGDVLPMIGLGAGLQRRGFDATVVCAPVFEEEVRAAGLAFRPLGSLEDIESAIGDPDLWHPVRGLQAIARHAILKLMRPLYAEIAGRDPAKTALVASGLAFGARLAQEKLGFRLVTAHLQASILMSAHDPAELGGVRLPRRLPLRLRKAFLAGIERGVVDRILAPDLNRFRTELGLNPVRRIFSRWMHSPQGVLGLFPEWFTPPQPDWPPKMSLTGFIRHEPAHAGLSPALEAFLDAGDPPIVFTAGSANVQGEAFFRTALQASAGLGRRSVLLTRFAHQIPERLPDNAFHAVWEPMSRLLERAALLVHHGGVGTTAQALAAGLPQLITPLAHDQFDNANRIRELGVGDRLDPRRLSARRTTQVLGQLLGDTEVGKRAGQLAKKIDFEASLERACDAVTEMLGLARPVQG